MNRIKRNLIIIHISTTVRNVTERPKRRKLKKRKRSRKSIIRNPKDLLQLKPPFYLKKKMIQSLLGLSYPKITLQISKIKMTKRKNRNVKGEISLHLAIKDQESRKIKS